jgi:1-acyl-sn-glycerol-3-phosphate acyltransferase
MAEDWMRETAMDVRGRAETGGGRALGDPAADPVVPLSWDAILHRPLPQCSHSLATRFWVRVLMGVFRRRFLTVEGLEHVTQARDPFILALNHSQRPEALLVPAFLAFAREGRMVHFFTDWLVLLYPLLARVVLLHGPIIVTRKQARPAWLNRFRKRYENPVAPFDQAAALLAQGRSVGIFPEGTMNRDRSRLLRGFSGAAQLSLATGMSVVPAGIRFPRGDGAGPVRDGEPFSLHFGPPLRPPVRTHGAEPQVAEIRDWHAQIMQAISRLSGKQWTPANQRTRYVA